MVPSAESVCQSEQVGELGDADGLRVDVVLVDWVFIWTTRSVADVVFKNEGVEPRSFAAAILGAASMKSVFVHPPQQKGAWESIQSPEAIPGEPLFAALLRGQGQRCWSRLHAWVVWVRENLA